MLRGRAPRALAGWCLAVADPPPRYAHSRALFLQLLGLVYLVAFASLAPQILGLVGADGLIPAAGYLDRAHDLWGADAYRRLPTLLWAWSADAALLALCGIGGVLAAAAIAGRATAAAFGALWACYLSLSVAGQDFLSFQWDALLLETGLLAVLYAPAGWPGRRRPAAEPGAAARWLVWGLAFKLTFLSGVTKLASGDPTWRSLTALRHHFETQPLPTPAAWYAHHAPEWVGVWAAGAVLAIEIAAPFVIFVPPRFRRVRTAGCGLLCLMQGAIAVTGNYGFFNLLTAVLYLALLDDAVVARLCPWQRAPAAQAPGAPDLARDLERRVDVVEAAPRGAAPDVPPAARTGSAPPPPPRAPAAPATDPRPPLPPVTGGTPSGAAAQGANPSPAAAPAWRRIGRGAIAAALALLSALTLVREIRRPDPLPAWGGTLLGAAAPLRSVHGYGLFRTMTTARPEIVIEGTADGAAWAECRFRWKPGDPAHAPRIVQPHMPRLDWQMWFAALDPAGQAHWLIPLAERLVDDAPAIRPLLGAAPCPGGPPRAVRLVLYRYRFTTPSDDAGGAWWIRERLGPLTDPIRRRP